MMANGVVEGKPIVWPRVFPRSFPTTPQSTRSGDGCEPVIFLSSEVEKGLAIEPPNSTVAFSPSPSKQTCSVEPNRYLHLYAIRLCLSGDANFILCDKMFQVRSLDRQMRTPKVPFYRIHHIMWTEERAQSWYPSCSAIPLRRFRQHTMNPSANHVLVETRSWATSLCRMDCSHIAISNL